MKQKPTSAAFNEAQIAAALAAAPEQTVCDLENPATEPGDWDDAVASRSLAELRDKLAIRRRGPGKKPAKIPTTIRFDADLVDALKATGNGWQSRVNDALRAWAEAEHLLDRDRAER